jgi:hypothetical protein
MANQFNPARAPALTASAITPPANPRPDGLSALRATTKKTPPEIRRRLQSGF